MAADSAAMNNSDRAERHAYEAERLLKDRFVWSYLKAQVHASLAVYYSSRSHDEGGR